MTEPELYHFLIREADGSARKIAYWSWGNKAAPKVLFCVHGMTRNGRDFDFLARHFGDDYRIICPDVAGRGKSDWLKDKSGYHNFTYAADMLRLTQLLKLPEIYWLGTSMGGLIGILIAASQPGLIKKMALNDIGPFIPKSALKRIAEYTGQNPVFPDLEAAKKYFRAIYAPWGVKNDEDLEHMMTYSLVGGAGELTIGNDPGIGANFRDEKGDLKELPDFDLWEFWDKITCPVLVLRGETSDIFPKEVAEKMRDRGPKAKVIEFPGIGHAPSLMEESQVRVLTEWFNA